MKTLLKVAWTSCPAVSELACLIDAIPRTHRRPILVAALQPNSDFTRSYFVGNVRAQLASSLEEMSQLKLVSILPMDPASLRGSLAAFLEAADLAQVQLAVCDLLIAVQATQQQGQ